MPLLFNMTNATICIVCAGEADIFIEGIAEAIEDDEKVSRKHAQSMFIGPGGSGKSFIHVSIAR